MDVEVDCTHAFCTAADFSGWLALNHARESRIWVRIAKKASGVPSLDWSEAVIAAVAWGWIDGIKKAGGPASWLQRFTPRRRRSIWSRRNRDIAERLIADGLMRLAGLAAVDAAKANGRWESAYAGSAAMEFPPGFMARLSGDATAAFEGLGRARRHALYLRLRTAKNTDTRERITTAILLELAGGGARDDASISLDAAPHV
jgi:uncharacterized protein YdeI (YjbR/CyaY-like superfamily)